MKTKHTKGAWEFIAPTIVSVETKEDIALIKAMSMGASRNEESLANAKLIAAAPDLARACETIFLYHLAKSFKSKAKEPFYMDEIRKALVKAGI